MMYSQAKPLVRCSGCGQQKAQEDYVPVCRECWEDMTTIERIEHQRGVAVLVMLNQLTIQKENEDGDRCEVARLAKAVEQLSRSVAGNQRVVLVNSPN